MGQSLLTKFENLRPGVGSYVSGLLPSTPLAIGAPMMISAVDADSNDRTFAVANGRIDGFLNRPSRAQVGKTVTEELLGLTSTDGGGEISTPYTVSDMGTIIPPPNELIVEGIDYLKITAGADQITAALAVDTELTVKAGKFAKAATGELVQYKIRKQLTVTDTTVASAEQVRLQIYRVTGYVKA